MRKISIILTIIIFSFLKAKSQGNYFNYWDSTVEYKYRSSSFDFFTGDIIFKFITKYFDGDTLINNQYYYKQFSLDLDSVYSYSGTFLYKQINIIGPKFLRETQSLKFVEYNISAYNEIVLFDDSSVLFKDTLNGIFRGSSYNYDAMCNIGFIDSVKLNQRFLKRECGVWGYYPSNACLVEGIGALSLSVCSNAIADADDRLVCFKKQNDSISFSDNINCNSFLSPTRKNHFTNILPLKLLSFNAKLQTPNSVALNWQTANEVNVSHFNIQRSNNGKDFTGIGKVNASCCSYEFQDSPPLEGLGVVYYRLEMVDKDGSKTYSEVRQLAIDNKQMAINIYPNPAKDFVTIECKGAKELLIIDYLGKEVYRKKIINNQESIMNVQRFSKGIYIVKVMLNNGDVKTEKLLVE